MVTLASGALSIAAGTGDVLMSRNTVRGPPTPAGYNISTVVFADRRSSCPSALGVVPRQLRCQLPCLLIRFPRRTGTLSPLGCFADVAENLHVPSRVSADAAPVLIVRRVTSPRLLVPNWPSSPASITASSPTENLGTGGRPSPPRRDRECHPRPQARRRPQSSPLGPFPANGAWLAVQITWPAGPGASVWARGW